MYTFGLRHRCQHRVLADKVADHDEASAAAVERSEQGFLHPIHEPLHTCLVPAQFVVVEVVDDDIVGAAASVAQAARGLPAAAGEEGAAVGRHKLAVLPIACVILHAEVGDILLVVLQLRLQVSEQRFGVLLGLANEDHYVDLARLLYFQPQGHEDVEVRTLGVTACPLFDSFIVRVLADAVRGLDVKRGALGMFSRRRVVGVVREVMVYEEVVVGPGTPDAGLLLGWRLRANGRPLFYENTPLPPLGIGFYNIVAHRYCTLPILSCSTTNLFCRSFTTLRNSAVTSGSNSARCSSQRPKDMKHSM